MDPSLTADEPMVGTGVVVRGVVHRLNNLLGAASGYVELLEMEREELPEHSREFLDELVEALEEAGSLGQQFLRFARCRDREREILSLASVVEFALAEGALHEPRDRLEASASVLIEVNPLSLREALLAGARLLGGGESLRGLHVDIADAEGGGRLSLMSRGPVEDREAFLNLLAPCWADRGMLFSNAQDGAQDRLQTDAALLQVVAQAHGGRVSGSIGPEGRGCIDLMFPACKLAQTPQGGLR
ncbi:MAG: histidine kinase dimerization/phospho-acceptor domain-containing protein [Planctomycetota bacterium]|jgi:signal transduction histidine kinase